jgi:hypothetical protein
MTLEDKELWKKISAFSLDDPTSAFTFTHRLARENNWPLAYALKCVHEYKRFIFLICAANEPLTPSDQVDQVWHLHLLYTQNYWHEWCRDTLGRDIHHGPTKGGSSEQAKYNNLYERAKEVYAKYFEQPPPDDIWPDSKTRFTEINFLRVNTDKYWLIKKPKF